jgi:hypothetical protein
VGAASSRTFSKCHRPRECPRFTRIMVRQFACRHARSRHNPKCLEGLRKRDPGAAKPYNFALSPILLHPSPDCTLIAPASKHPEEWLTREYTEIHSGETVRLLGEYQGKVLLPQTLSSVTWRHYLHPEDKSLSPDEKPCDAYTRGLLMRRPIQAMTPFIFIGKEIERRAQEGEDLSVLENARPTRPAAPPKFTYSSSQGQRGVDLPLKGDQQG